MATRKLINGEEAEQLDKAITISLYTKCPSKYLLIDLETNQTYRGSDNPDKMWVKQENSVMIEFIENDN